MLTNLMLIQNNNLYNLKKQNYIYEYSSSIKKLINGKLN